MHCVANALRQIARFVDVDARVELWRDDEDGADLLDGVDWVIGKLLILEKGLGLTCF